MVKGEKWHNSKSIFGIRLKLILTCFFHSSLQLGKVSKQLICSQFIIWKPRGDRHATAKFLLRVSCNTLPLCVAEFNNKNQLASISLVTSILVVKFRKDLYTCDLLVHSIYCPDTKCLQTMTA